MKKNLVAPKTKEEMEILRNTQEEKKRIWTDHLKKHESEFKPMTRRELLNAGVISSVGYMAVPSLIGLLPKMAQAAGECDAAAAAGATRLPYININLAGGFGSSMNMVVLDQAGAPLASYNVVGVNSANFVKDFNGGNWNNTSGFRAGMNTAITDANARARTTALIVSCGSGDDSSNNPLSNLGNVIKAGLTGEVLPAMGTSNTLTGVGSVPAGTRPAAPLVVRSVNDITGAVNVQGALAGLSAAQKNKLFETIGKLNASQVRKLAGMNASDGLETILKCADEKNLQLVQSAGALQLNVTQNAQLAPIWTADQVNGSIVMNVLNGNAPAAAINLGGYDYHGNNRATTDQRDNQAGTLVGRIIQSASVLQRPVFIHVTTDGSVSCDGAGNPASDSGSRSAQYMIVYDPAAAPKVKDNFNQLGFMTAAQTAATNTTVGATPDRAAFAVFANWAFYSTGSNDLFNKVLPGVFNAAQLTEVVKLTK